ncbi:isatin hydrolase-like [Lineus longissimus]|uniref:isatin hydrolase-like n=1 Tax=Lineus longissimus TaxID=88925 RepID=UPI002B4F0922
MQTKYPGCVFLAVIGIVTSVPIKMADNVLDLSYDYVNKVMPYFPGNKAFNLKPVFKGTVTVDGFKKMYTARNEFETAEHGGTHYDAPSHFCNTPKCWYPEDIPVSMFYGEACVVNVAESANKTPNYGLSVNDLMTYERKYGKIPQGAYVIMYSGWGKYFDNKTAYMGHETDMDMMAWPSFSPQAMKWLLDERDIKGIGVDSLSLDVPSLKYKLTHILAMGRNKIGYENLANVEKMPARGATIVAFPMKIKGGTGGPARVVAMWNGSTRTTVNILSLVIAALSVIIYF